MKKFTTTFFLLLAIVLLLPTEAKGADVYLVCNADGAGWDSNSGLKFTQAQVGDVYILNVPASKITNDGNQLRFRVKVEGWGGEMCPYGTDGTLVKYDFATLIKNKNSYSISNDCYTNSSNANKDSYFYFEKGDYDSYDFTVSIADNNRYIKVEGVMATTPVVSYTLKYGTTEVSGTATDNGATFKIPYTAYNNGLSFTISDSEGKIYNPSLDTSLSNGVSASYAENGSGKWSCSELANARGYSVTLNTEGKTVTLDWSTNVIVPSITKNLYLVGNFLSTDNGINYDCRYFKLTDNGNGTYYMDIPVSLVADFQLLYDDGITTTLYGPQGSGYGVNVNNPQNSQTISGNLYAATQNPLANYWSQTNRFTSSAEAGMYRITITVGSDGMPSSWEIEHDPLTRVAYYLPDMENASLQPSYVTRSQTSGSFNNVYFGYVYLPAKTGCYVVSNVCGNDYWEYGLLKTKNKLYLQGNKSGGNPDTKADGDARNLYTKVYPLAGDSKPFVFNNEKNMSMFLEYAPARGNNNYIYDEIYGEIMKSNQTPTVTGGSELPTEFESMKIIGPAIGDDTWSTDKGLLMEYNPADNCWEVSFDTTFPAKDEKKFRFIANDNWKYSWEENGTEDAEKAKIPYDDASKIGQPATVETPNKVALVNQETTTSADTRTQNLDIIFNRDPGHWTVKFYIEVTGSEGSFKYDFKYTINGTPTITVPVDLTYRVNKFIRSFSYGDNLDLPEDESVKAYEAYRFEKGDKTTKNHGTVYLRRITYIPANMGVVLVGEVPEGESFTDGNVKSYNLAKRTGELVDKNEDLWWMKDEYKDDSNWSEWNNYLVGTVIAVNDLGNAKVEDGEIVARYFGLGHYWATNEYKKTHEGDDYIGFFRYTEDAISRANRAYLSIPAKADYNNGGKYGYIDFNGQWLDDGYDSPNSGIQTLSRAAIVFDDLDLGETTAIKTVVTDEEVGDNAYYTLQGVKVYKPAQGIYIHNGKKIIIK